ncbi:MAG: 1-acyl-sn-glycerol-3-phosphate acyltransferase [Rhodospirillales bacterium]|nr:1-acyl-sn-glycerol-3-phosphate acyltransferase [Rhodospirillales bacterium]
MSLRSLAFNLFFFGLTTAMLFTMWVFLVLPRRATQWIVRVWTRGVWWGLRHIVGLDYEVRGREHIPPGAVLLASKHQSTWDTAVFYLLFDDPCYVLKSELFQIPVWGWYARKARMIGVDRKGRTRALRKMVQDCVAALDRGRALIIFPEGTRTAPGERRRYQPGIAAVYAQANAPVVPVAVNSGVFWGRRSFIKRPGTVVLEFLPPIAPGLSREDFMTALETSIEGASERLAREATTATPINTTPSAGTAMRR